MTEDNSRSQEPSGAPRPTPALKPLEALIGEWRVEMTFPGAAPVQSAMSFTWLDDGAFALMRMGDHTSGLPWSTVIIGRDQEMEPYTLLYYDWRGVSRVYQMSLSDGVWKQWRTAPGFSQRFHGVLSDDRQTITTYWEKSSDGAAWEHDFDLTYTKIRQAASVHASAE